MKKINEIVGEAKTIAIAGHVRPDGDCVGSCMALYNYLKRNRQDLTVKVYLEYVDKKFDMIANVSEIITDGYDGTKYDLFISLDTASLDRLGRNAAFFHNAKRTVCIDHHASNPGYADYNYIVSEASSASEVLFYVLDEDKFDKSIAEPMYMGIAHDSGVFRFSTTTPETMRIAARMMEYGVHANEILEETFYRKTYSQFMVTAKIQNDAILCMEGKCIYGFCTSKTMKEFGVTSNDLDAVIASLRNVDGVEVALFAYQLEEDRYKISLRSKRYVDVSKIAIQFGGGGHVRAAGFDIEGSLEEVLEKVLAVIKGVL